MQHEKLYRKTASDAYEIFTFNYDELCIGEIKNTNCASTNADFYGIVDWKRAPPHTLCTVYITSNSLKKYKTSNYWITAADSSTFKTIGTLRWSLLYYDTHSGEDDLKTTLPNVRSFVSAASGVFQNLSNAHLLMDFSSSIRKIHVFTNERRFLSEGMNVSKTSNM
jgi:hypothetical protein